MLQLQFLRAILLVSNAVSATICLGSARGWYLDVFDVLAGFLIASWVTNVLVLLYTAWRLRVASRGYEYFRVPVHNDDFGVPYIDPTNKPSMGSVASVVIKVCDIIFIIPFLTLMILGFIRTSEVAAVFACIGAMVAIIVHGFCFIASFDFKLLRRYKIKLVVVRSDEQVLVTRRVQQQKERSTSQVQSAREPDPESISPRPYRGSPSTKPSKDSKSPDEDGTIKLIEATEADALIADHD